MQQLLAYFSLLWSGKTTLKKIKGCISCTEEPLQTSLLWFLYLNIRPVFPTSVSENIGEI